MTLRKMIVTVILSTLMVLWMLSPGQTKSRETFAAERSYTDPAIGSEFVLVKGGCYEMGDVFGDGEKDQKPVHKVCIADFYLSKHDVTVGDFRKFVKDTGYATDAERSQGCAVWNGSRWQYDGNKNWRNPGFAQDDQHPVVCVSWNDAKAFAEWISRKTKVRYCLPTEAEWEYAARSRGRNYRYSWGNGKPSGNIGDESLKRSVSGLEIWAGYDDGFVYTSPVGSFKPNELGLYDMTGNVWQWTADWYGETYYKESPKDNPTGTSQGPLRVLRGGSWSNKPGAVRVMFRNKRFQADRSAYFGFRLKAKCPRADGDALAKLERGHAVR